MRNADVMLFPGLHAPRRAEMTNELTRLEFKSEKKRKKKGINRRK